MARTISMSKTRKAIAEAYGVNKQFVDDELVDQFINYRKAA